MKKIACFLAVSALSAASISAQAQDLSSEPAYSVSKLSYPSSKTSLIGVSNTQSLGMNSPFDFDYTPGKQAKRGLHIRELNSTKLHFSTAGKFDYGLDFSLERQRDVANLDPLAPASYPSSALTPNLSTAAFLNYRINPIYSLNSSIRYSNGYDRGTQLSIGAKANKVFGKRHNLTAVFSVNWNHSPGISKNTFGFSDWRQSQNYLSLHSNQFNRSEIHIGTNWNWNIDTNWSLSTGISARHMLSSPAKNPFVTHRTPVTIFSVATYRF